MGGGGVINLNSRGISVKIDKRLQKFSKKLLIL